MVNYPQSRVQAGRMRRWVWSHVKLPVQDSPLQPGTACHAALLGRLYVLSLKICS